MLRVAHVKWSFAESLLYDYSKGSVVVAAEALYVCSMDKWVHASLRQKEMYCNNVGHV